eukprot:CAMPEP_0114625394 /NCGR_PEP_ID=MMETSP0168-20121206/11248_1 /TAXON_ID=95228 ORGANISM="Vannella sp., Strain DIVA3 517/6/12" /NCGR_SAMPLE_ID=MMETSP0168 /ASSEMBLY_ACC=CAM_ASM_000044 /LENGTH=419 /DNA_ID=CAMNT_0001836675 /DNA_START=16 /DNA_END=1272 /DNA_ORIENTATION=-
MRMARWSSSYVAAVVMVLLTSAMLPQCAQAGFWSYGSFYAYDDDYWSDDYWSTYDFSWLIVDTFTAEQPQITLSTYHTQRTTVAVGSGILGGERDVSLIGSLQHGYVQPGYAKVWQPATSNYWSSYGWGGSTDSDEEVCLQYYNGRSYGGDSSYPGTVVVQWDGVDGAPQLDTSGLDQVDLTADGAFAFVASGQGISTSHFVDAAIRVYSYGSTTLDFCSCRLLFRPQPSLTFAFYNECEHVNEGCDMGSVGALELWVEDTLASFEICQLGTYAGTEATPLPSHSPSTTITKTPTRTRSQTRTRSTTRSHTPTRTVTPVAFLTSNIHQTVEGEFDFQTGFISTAGHSAMQFSVTTSTASLCMFTHYNAVATPTSFDYMVCATPAGGAATVTYQGSDFLDGWYYGMLYVNGTAQAVVSLS